MIKVNGQGAMQFTSRHIHVSFYKMLICVSKVKFISTGMIGCIMPSLGILLGGHVMRKKHLLPKGSFLLAFLSVFIYIAFLIPMMILPCADINYAGHVNQDGR